MPHNWTGAEMLCLLRDLFVVEADDHLVLGQGVPRSWLTPGSRFGVQDLPTRFGRVSYTAVVGERGRLDLQYQGPEACTVAWNGRV